jgi:hypothetical protein
MKAPAGKNRMDRAAFALLAFLFCLPGLLTLAVSLVPEASWQKLPNTDWLRNRTLRTVEDRLAPKWAWNTLLVSRDLKETAAAFNRGYAGREVLIRLFNEAFFRIFNESTMNDSFTFAESGWVFETAYLREYCLQRIGRGDLEPLVEEIARLQDLCRRRGMGFVLLITPSKVSLYPEKAPARWIQRKDPRPRGYDVLRPLLDEKGVAYVDGPALARREKDRRPDLPLFSEGGSHWASPLVLATGQALMEALRQQGVPLAALEAETRRSPDPYSRAWDSDQESNDTDALSMAHLALDWSFPAMRCAVQPSPHPPRQDLAGVFVGGSFTFGLANQWVDTGMFDQLDVYYYYHEAVRNYFPGIKAVRINAKGETDFPGKIFAADFLVLEVNEQRIPEPPLHWKLFLADALAHAGDFPEKRLFRRDGYFPLARGASYSFLAGRPDSFSFWAASGLSFSGDYTWTDGKKAVIRLAVPEGGGQAVTIRMKAAAFVPKGLEPQTAVVVAGGEKVGEWSFSEHLREKEWEIRIPRRLLTPDGRISVEFQIGHPASPYGLGLSEDRRLLGLSLREIGLAGAGSGAQPSKSPR